MNLGEDFGADEKSRGNGNEGVKKADLEVSNMARGKAQQRREGECRNARWEIEKVRVEILLEEEGYKKGR